MSVSDIPWCNVYSGVEMMKQGVLDNAAENMNTEYGDLMVCVEVVPSLDAAMAHIHTYGRYL